MNLPMSIAGIYDHVMGMGHAVWVYFQMINPKWLVSDSENDPAMIQKLWVQMINPIVEAYPLVNEHSYWKWPFIVSFPIKIGDFP